MQALAAGRVLARRLLVRHSLVHADAAPLLSPLLLLLLLLLLPPVLLVAEAWRRRERWKARGRVRRDLGHGSDVGPHAGVELDEDLLLGVPGGRVVARPPHDASAAVADAARAPLHRPERRHRVACCVAPGELACAAASRASRLLAARAAAAAAAAHPPRELGEDRSNPFGDGDGDGVGNGLRPSCISSREWSSSKKARVSSLRKGAISTAPTLLLRRQSSQFPLPFFLLLVLLVVLVLVLVLLS